AFPSGIRLVHTERAWPRGRLDDDRETSSRVVRPMTPGGARAKTNKRKVLVVEDEKDIRDLIRYNLEQDGFAVLDTDEGELALALVKRERPALVILDIMLPGMSGLEICRAIRQDDETADLPILMLTARAAEVDKVVGLEMGADDYVTKPFSPRELLARIKAVLRRA